MSSDHMPHDVRVGFSVISLHFGKWLFDFTIRTDCLNTDTDSHTVVLTTVLYT